MSRPALWLLSIALLGAGSDPGAAADGLIDPDYWKTGFQSTDVEGIFRSVAEGIRYEPYPGVQRGAEGAAVSAAGNAWDQSLLLARLLRENGYRVRFARGPLPEQNLQVLIRGLYPPRVPEPDLAIDFRPYDPASDATLLTTGSDHVWVELAQGDEWLPLDPAYPRARAGEAYATATGHLEAPDETDHQWLTIRLLQTTAGGEERVLFSDSGPVSHFALRPLWFAVTASPLMPAEKKGRAATLTFGAPAAEPAAQDEPERKGTNFHWTYGMDDKALDRGSVTVLDQQPDLRITREWLEFVIDYPGRERDVVERELMLNPADLPPAFRRYQLLVVPGRLDVALADHAAKRAAAQFHPESLQAALAAAADSGDAEDALVLEARAGAIAHFLLGLRFAVESDVLTDRLAWLNGVATVHDRPRLILSSVVSDDAADAVASARIEMDLRLDRVRGLPFPGYPAASAELFQTARGLQESMLEGSLLATLVPGGSAVTTAVLMQQALAAGIGLRVVSAPGAADPAWPVTVRRQVDAALAAGHDVIIPERAIDIDGAQRWGWWQVNRASGEVIGVMDTGLHAAMAEYTLDLSKVSLDDRMGLVIGAIVGATTTHITIAALILEYGEAGEALKEQVQAIVERITCLSCPNAEATASASAGASASVSIGGDCLSESVEKGKGVEGGAKLSSGGFCDNYVRGFKCASGLILNGLTTEMSTEIGVSAGATVKFGCD